MTEKNIGLEYWSRVNSEWESSRRSQLEFCRERNLNIHNFRYWRGRIKSAGDKNEDLSVLQLDYTLPFDRLPTASFRTEGITITLSGNSDAKITVSGSLTIASLAKILEACAEGETQAVKEMSNHVSA